MTPDPTTAITVYILILLAVVAFGTWCNYSPLAHRVSAKYDEWDWK